jgi:hypothetical protein
VTDAADGDTARRVTEAVAEITDARSVIDQAKGMLMLIYGFGEQDAFELIRAQARRTQTNVRALALQFRDDVATLNHQESIPSKDVIEQLLLTTHERVRRSASRSPTA